MVDVAERTFRGNDQIETNIQGRGKKKGKTRDVECLARDMISALALCHNVTPTYENDKVEYQASSPDEVALVKFAKSLDMQLVRRD
jgi:phospholipid-translocating ATPase